MNKVVHFEIPVEDLSASKTFYGHVFGWKFSDWDENYVVATTVETDEKGLPKEVGAINGGLQKRGNRAVAPTIVIQVDDIDDTLREIYAQGGSVVIEREKIGDMGYYAQFTDPEGNRIGLFEQIKK